MIPFGPCVNLPISIPRHKNTKQYPLGYLLTCGRKLNWLTQWNTRCSTQTSKPTFYVPHPSSGSLLGNQPGDRGKTSTPKMQNQSAEKDLLRIRLDINFFGFSTTRLSNTSSSYCLKYPTFFDMKKVKT